MLARNTTSCGRRRQWIPIDQGDGTLLVPLTRGLFTRIDAIDLDRIRHYSWHRGSARNGGRTYARTRIKRKITEMHRLLMDPPAGLEVDHINRNILDNRRCNLRICTHAQNAANRHGWTPHTSRHRGISWDKNRERWVAQIYQNGKTIWYHSFSTEEEAHQAYEAKAREVFGEFYVPYNV